MQNFYFKLSLVSLFIISFSAFGFNENNDGPYVFEQKGQRQASWVILKLAQQATFAVSLISLFAY